MLLCIGILGANNVFAKNIYPSYTYTRTDSGKLFYDIAVGTTTSVAVGKNGRIYYDAFGNWKPAELDSFDDFYYVFFTGDKFVALGKHSVISSIDGQTWTVIKNDGISSDGLVTYSNGMFMIEKSDGIYTTADFQEYSKLSSAGSRLNIVQSSIQIPKLMIDAADTDRN